MVKREDRDPCKVYFDEPSLTKQSFKDECDVNRMMKNFENQCGADFLATYQGFVSGQFGDFSQVMDYQSALDQLRAADAVFMALPAEVRKRFDNSAAQFLDFCHDEKNIDEMVAMGLAERKEVITPVSKLEKAKDS